jgi:hydroxymethylpyrimidine/phosphomethylpyrimidine kinase
MPLKVLTIAGFDGSAGAGIQADLKTFSALGCYGMSVLTALPVQNTCGVKSIYELPIKCIEEQLQAVFEDSTIDAIKIGMLHKKEIIEIVAKTLAQLPYPKIVLDPVMVAKSGDPLLNPDAVCALKKHLFPLASVITPNLMEASTLLQREISSKKEMEQGAFDLLQLGPKAVVVKGGHLEESNCGDCLYDGEIFWLSHPRIDTKNTHGTGCTFSSAIASFLARGHTLFDAVSKAKAYLTQSIIAGKDFQIGKGKGPVHHFHYLWSFL